MAAYLGEKRVESLAGTPFDGFLSSHWAMEFIARYGQIDGAHHKQWVLDQVARILRGTPVLVSVARWDDGNEEFRIETADPPSNAYLEWVEEQKSYNSSTDEYEYEYSEGTAP